MAVSILLRSLRNIFLYYIYLLAYVHFHICFKLYQCTNNIYLYVKSTSIWIHSYAIVLYFLLRFHESILFIAFFRVVRRRSKRSARLLARTRRRDWLRKRRRRKNVANVKSVGLFYSFPFFSCFDIVSEDYPIFFLEILLMFS